MRAKPGAKKIELTGEQREISNQFWDDVFGQGIKLEKITISKKVFDEFYRLSTLEGKDEESIPLKIPKDFYDVIFSSSTKEANDKVKEIIGQFKFIKKAKDSGLSYHNIEQFMYGYIYGIKNTEKIKDFGVILKETEILIKNKNVEKIKNFLNRKFVESIKWCLRDVCINQYFLIDGNNCTLIPSSYFMKYSQNIKRMHKIIDESEQPDVLKDIYSKLNAKEIDFLKEKLKK